jgi:hypothetical protein
MLWVYLQRQNVERAKLTLLNDKRDGPGDGNDIDRQSDHLLMMIAYKRWETILNGVSVILICFLVEARTIIHILSRHVLSYIYCLANALKNGIAYEAAL